MYFVNVIVGTPIWVWIVFVFLIIKGVRALNDREMEIKNLFIMPLFFLLWGGLSVVHDLAFSLWGLAAMLVGLVIGCGCGWCFWRRGPQLKSKEGSNSIIWPGTSWVIKFVMIAFVIKYVLSFSLNIDPDLRDSLYFNLIFGLLSGLISGVLWGRTLNLYFTFSQTKQHVLF
ncbi:DUF6622 family protein [Aeromonas media]|uniref:DUF6622 family protein n=1 Tax=Aeromonas media TaxID=651 RepID=UPI0029D6A5F5|nr:DUF6622 family protein [Aeromonas media]MDX7899255.1 DUF6622 family protein [Aeromonas media]